jgi:hypothetical protein
MKLFKLLLLPCLLLIGAAGCATGPAYSQYRADLPAPRDGYGRIWFYRPTVVAAEIQPVIKLDEKIVGHAVPQGFFSVDVPPGPHTVSASMVWKHSIVVNVSSNGDSYVRFTPLFGFMAHHFMPEEVNDSLAPTTMQSLRLAIR